MHHTAHKENRQHGTADFPFVYYDVAPTHPRYHMVYHWHTEFEIMRIITGMLLLQINGITYEAKKDDVFFISGGSLHRAIPYNAHYECIVFDINYFLNKSQLNSSYHYFYSFVHFDRIIKTKIPYVPHILQLYSDIAQTIQQKKIGYEMKTPGLFYLFFSIILEKKFYSVPTLLTQTQKNVDLIKKTVEYIYSHYDEDISLQDLANVISMNQNYFCRFFKEITNQTPFEYINEYRIEMASEKLLHTHLTITEIAVSCSFNDASYFTKVFKKYKAMSPRAFRNKFTNTLK